MDLNKELVRKDLAHIWHPCSQMGDYLANLENLDSKKDYPKDSKNSKNIESITQKVDTSRYAHSVMSDNVKLDSTNAKKFDNSLPLIPIKRAKGVYLYDFNGKKYIDCISSWWVNLFGHNNAYINKKIKKQLRDLEHIIMAGFTHKPIIDLSARLCGLLPGELQKCFFADNGSSGIEVALKMSFHYFKNMESRLESKRLQNLDSKTTESKPQRNLFLSLENSYHGETLGALSVGDVKLYKSTYEPLLLKNITTPVPRLNVNIESSSNIESSFNIESNTDSIHSSKIDVSIESCLQHLDSILSKYGENIAAFIIEPLVQCAGNMNMYPPSFVKRACEKCRAHGILIIFDEIATGFGRTGSMFALQQCDFVPDILCLSKGISGGYLPLCAVVSSDKIYNAFCDSRAEKAFLHSHSYTGNALACAAANATLDIFERENVIAKNRVLSGYIWGKLNKMLSKDSIKHKVRNIRYCGMIFAFDLELNNTKNYENTKFIESKNSQDSIESSNFTDSINSQDSNNFVDSINLGRYVYKEGLKCGLILRPLGNTIYLMPPYIITKKQIKYILKKLKKILKSL